MKTHRKINKNVQFNLYVALDYRTAPLSFLLNMTRTVQLNCPIKDEIRAVDSQSDLRIFL